MQRNSIDPKADAAAKRISGRQRREGRRTAPTMRNRGSPRARTAGELAWKISPGSTVSAPIR
jgi:hypothetical protein